MIVNSRSVITIAWNRLEKLDKAFNPNKNLKDCMLLFKTAKIINTSICMNEEIRSLHDLMEKEDGT